MDAMTASIPVSAYRAEAMTAEEIDAHPDSARIWATIKMLRDEIDGAMDEATEKAETKGYEAGRDYESGKNESDIRDAIRILERCL